MNPIIASIWLVGCGVTDPSDPESTVADVESRNAAAVARDGHACDEGSRGELRSLHFARIYTQRGLERYWDSWLTGLSALGYIDDVVEPDVQNGAIVFDVSYCTVDADGSPVEGTGTLALPLVCGTSPTVIYSHGTSVYRFDTPSNLNVNQTFDGPTPMVIFAGGGYVYLAPDLTGFGGSSAPYHRYFHADTAADNTIDMLLAVQTSSVYTLATDDRLFNAGFSQGGQTALAFASEAEDLGLEIEATATVGGVFDPEPWFDWLLEQTDNPYLTLYAADLLVSYDRIYGDVYSDPAAAFSVDYADTVEGLFDMNSSYVTVVDGMASSVAELTTPDFYAEIDDPDSVMRGYLRDNAVVDVCLDSPMRLWHLENDDEVPYDQAVDWADQLSSCNDVEFVPWIDTNHLNTWHQVLPEIRSWFNTF